MGNLFGVRRKAPTVTKQDRAILQLKQQRDKIKIYQKKTETDLEKTKELAIQLFQSGHKERALVLLRRKKCMEEILSRTDNQLSTLEQLVSDIEYTQIEVSVVEGLKVGTEALKQLNSLMNIDDIQQMMEDNEEAAEKQREISDILQQSAVRYDEDELLKELDSYAKVAEKEEEHQLQPNVEQNPIEDLPKVPETEPPSKDTSKLDNITVEDKLENLPDVPNETVIHEKKRETRQLEEAQ